MKTEIFKKIILDLQDDSFFAGYKFIKSERTLFFNNEDDTVSLILEHWRDYYDNTCVIRPIYGRHFNVLSKWFEKYNLKPLRQQRIAPQITYVGAKSVSLDGQSQSAGWWNFRLKCF